MYITVTMVYSRVPGYAYITPGPILIGSFPEPWTMCLVLLGAQLLPNLSPLGVGIVVPVASVVSATPPLSARHNLLT